MIKVNLLPQELSGKASKISTSSNEGTGMVLLAVVLFLGLLGGGGFFVYSSYANSHAQLDAANRESARIDADLKKKQKEYEELRTSLDELQSQVAVLQSLDPPDRLLWSEKLNILPALVPENVFLTELEVKESVTERETDESRRAYEDWVAKGSKGTPPARRKQPIVRQTFEFAGIAYSPDNRFEARLDKITEFVSNLQQKSVKIPFTGEETTFSRGFVPDVRPIAPVEATRVGNREVTRFRFAMTTREVKVVAEKFRSPMLGGTTTPAGSATAAKK